MKHAQSAAQKIYDQAQQEMNLVIEEISDLMKMIETLTENVYACGTILNRVESYMTEAEQLVEKAVINLEKAKKD